MSAINTAFPRTNDAIAIETVDRGSKCEPLAINTRIRVTTWSATKKKIVGGRIAKNSSLSLSSILCMALLRSFANVPSRNRLDSNSFLVADGFRGVLQTLQRVVNRKAAGLLARREFLKRGEELPDVLLCRHENKRMVNPPASIVYAFVVRGLEGIGAQIEKFRETKRHEWVLPHVQAMRALLGE